MSDMRTHRKEDFAHYAARLDALPFVERVALEHVQLHHQRLGQRVREEPPWDAVLHLRVAGREHHFRVEHKRTPRLNHALIETFLARAQRHGDKRWILFAPYVTAPLAARLHERGVNYVDLAGNCYLTIDKNHVAVIEGRRPLRRTEETQPTGVVGHRVIFALLARPQTILMTVRDIAHETGTGKTAVAVTLRRLERDGFIGRTKENVLLIKPKELLDRWLAGYLDALRPRLLAGYYRAADKDPFTLERRIEQELAPLEPPDDIRRDQALDKAHGVSRWVWGGVTAAFRLTGHYRGERTVIHMDQLPPDLTRRLRLLPARTGEIAILGTPGRTAYDGVVPRTAHPLLVYAELLATDDNRARETAAEVRDRFLRYLV